jgi:hypothetical protein
MTELIGIGGSHSPWDAECLVPPGPEDAHSTQDRPCPASGGEGASALTRCVRGAARPATCSRSARSAARGVAGEMPVPSRTEISAVASCAASSVSGLRLKRPRERGDWSARRAAVWLRLPRGRRSGSRRSWPPRALGTRIDGRKEAIGASQATLCVGAHVRKRPASGVACRDRRA